MATRIKRTKEKSVSIRLNDESYDFIAKKSTEKKLTKSAYLLSQLDKNSDLAIFLIEDEKRQFTVKKEIIAQINEIRKSIKISIIEDLNSVSKKEMKLSHFKYMYSNYIDEPEFRNWMIMRARKVGVDIE